MKVGKRLQEEINVIPLVDIVLVILIIFMITAPLMTSGLEVNLPQTKDTALAHKEREPLKITITAQGEIKISGEPVSLDRLYQWLSEAKKHNLVEEVQIEADRRAYFEIVAKVLSEVKRAGFTQVGVLTQPES
ncbi:MAG: ExbD/TolR family protein [Caldimicrobium sp.]|jgi:biopolymer transport protein TolR|uniref:Protein TolR n=1 Tax=Caldimicrobium thiodismutans TaxID=1653476 RepID=A0A2N7PIQ7_9BACT|nr:MAG: protein TolR [Caldimicrobium thiodismutans]